MRPLPRAFRNELLAGCGTEFPSSGTRIHRQGHDAAVAVVLGLGINGLGVVRALGRAGVPVVGLYSPDDPVGSFSRYCRALCVPARPTAKTLRSLNSAVSSASKTAVLLPTSDAYAHWINEHQNLLRPRFPPLPRPQRNGVHWLYLTRDAGSFYRKLGANEIDGFAWIRSLRRARSFAAFALDEFAPWIYETARLVQRTGVVAARTISSLSFQSASKSPAAPIPPPTHIVTIP